MISQGIFYCSFSYILIIYNNSKASNPRKHKRKTPHKRANPYKRKQKLQKYGLYGKEEVRKVFTLLHGDTNGTKYYEEIMKYRESVDEQLKNNN